MSRAARLIFLLIALAVASMVSYTVYWKSATPGASIIPEKKQDLVPIAVAARDIGRGTSLSAEDLRMVSYLKESLPPGTFSDQGKLVGRIAMQEVRTSEPVLESALAPTDLAKGGIAAIINPQKRAMAVRVDEVIGVAGFLQPGHLVDVLVSVDKPGEQREQITKAILENIPILSIGTQAEESADKKPKKVTVVTLEVSLEEGEKLALATNQGKIQLALRGYVDSDQILTRGTSVEHLLKSFATPSEKPVVVNDAMPLPLPQKKELVVEMMNGNKVDRVAIRAN